MPGEVCRDTSCTNTLAYYARCHPASRAVKRATNLTPEATLQTGFRVYVNTSPGTIVRALNLARSSVAVVRALDKNLSNYRVTFPCLGGLEGSLR